MSGGPWRITVDSWITEDADWYSRRTYVLDDVHSLPDALRKLAESPAEVYLDPKRQRIRRGKPPEVDVKES